MNVRRFLATHAFLKGTYRVEAIKRDRASPPRVLLSFRMAASDEDGARHVPEVSVAPDLEEHHLKLVLSALVRAGARHPGLRDEDLVRVHRAAQIDRHIELFTDINALTTGLLTHLVRSLGKLVARVVMSSSSVDVLHEWRSPLKRSTTSQAAFSKRAEMARSLHVLEEIRRSVPVHIHQLEPGATRYFHRSAAQGPTLDTEEQTYIAEDRQMIAAYWAYVKRANPRLPLFLVTSDFALAHVCAAERVVFLFATAPHELLRPAGGAAAPSPSMVWFDPFALALRACTPHRMLWELCLIYERLNVVSESLHTSSFSLMYEPRRHIPGEEERIERGALIPSATAEHPPPARGVRTGAAAKSQGTDQPDPDGSKGERKIKLSLRTILLALPTASARRLPIEKLPLSDEDSIRQYKLVGELTQLYRVEDDAIVAGPALEELLASLQAADYVAVNRIFRRQPIYERVLVEARAGAPFPSSKTAGAATGWTILLGAAYKSVTGVYYGLEDVSEEHFAASVARVHGEVGEGQKAVPLPEILDRTCRLLRLSPVRFETLLGATLGRGPLRDYEAQRAAVDVPIPEHEVIVYPSTAASESYLRVIKPGRGLVLRGSVVSSLVRRRESRSHG